jgi:hypothetical protein
MIQQQSERVSVTVFPVRAANASPASIHSPTSIPRSSGSEKIAAVFR